MLIVALLNHTAANLTGLRWSDDPRRAGRETPNWQEITSRASELGKHLTFGQKTYDPQSEHLLLSLLGIVTPSMLHRFRRFAIVGSIVLGAFITPGQDPMSLLLMAGPLYALYELSVILSAFVFRMKRKRELAEAA